ncbi:hypothetical protein J2772_000496 [Chryseobacterium jejuense]|nr:hypothetical protein [Chryseobacterium jejuense]
MYKTNLYNFLDNLFKERLIFIDPFYSKTGTLIWIPVFLNAKI